MMLRCVFLALAFALGVVLAAIEQAPQRVGMQHFQFKDTLWIDGGRRLNYDGSDSGQVPDTVSVNTTLDFDPPPAPGPTLQHHERSEGAPLVSHGFMWSNLVDQAWLFGGKHTGNNESTSIKNNIWRVSPDGAGLLWEELPINKESNSTVQRPYRGAGCNVPDLQRGYYLGGMTGEDFTDDVESMHWLHIFDFQTETLTALPVPDYVPVVNQSMVYINTATRNGALVALGGYVERGGNLTLAPMTSVFIFDIESSTWIEQAVTGDKGATESGGDQESPAGGAPGTDLPRMRMSACAVVGTSRDKTQHNIVFSGGQSEQTALLDTWILSLPSAIWVGITIHEPSMTPRAESSCILLNSHHTLMFGGCLLDSNVHQPCMSYTDIPFNWDIRTLGFSRYSHEPNGYSVPPLMSERLGGNSSGVTTQMNPMFSSFSAEASPILKDLFSPPQGYWLSAPFSYEPVVLYAIIVCLLLPVAPGLLSAFWFLNSRRKGKSDTASQSSSLFPPPPSPLSYPKRVYAKLRKLLGLPETQHSTGATVRTEDWKPWCFKLVYLLSLTIATMTLIALLILLLWRSEQLDPMVEHWPGGIDDEGTWSGTQFESTFIRSPTYDRPKQGLLTIYYDQNTEDLFNRKNSAQRLGRPVYFAFTFLCPLISVIYGRVWKTLDDEVKRLDPYYRLSRPGGSSAKRSICLNYHSFWAPLSIWQAFKYRHWTVFVSSLGAVLGTIVVPVSANYVFSWSLCSGALLADDRQYSWQVALVDPYWTAILLGVMGVNLVCAIILTLTLPRRDTGLCQDIRGIAGVLSLIPEGSNPFEGLKTKPDAHLLTSSRLAKDYGKMNFCLRMDVAGSGPILTLGGGLTSPSTSGLPTLLNFWRWRYVMILREKTFDATSAFLQHDQLKWVHGIKDLSENHGNFLPLHPLLFAIWLSCLFTLMVITGYIAAGLNKLNKNGIWDYRMPFPTDMYLVVGVFIQSIIDIIDHAVRALGPYYSLRQGWQDPEILWADYLSGIPIWEILVSFSRGHYLVCVSMLASLATTIFTIFLGALQLSSGAYGSTTFESDLSSSTAATMLLAFIIACQSGIAYCLIWRNIRPQHGWEDDPSAQPPMSRSDTVREIWSVLKGSSSTRIGTLLPRPPSTLLDIIPYVAFSPQLRGDLDLVASYPTRRKIDMLRHRHRRRYGLGFFPMPAQDPSNIQGLGGGSQNPNIIMFFGVGNHAPNSLSDVDMSSSLTA